MARLGAAVHPFGPRPAGAAARAPAVVGEPPEPRRRARGAAEAAWAVERAALADGLLAIRDPEARAEAFAVLAGRLAKSGDALLSADHARVLRSFGPGAGSAEPPDADEAALMSALPQRTVEELVSEAEMRADYEREYAAWKADLAERDAAPARHARRLRLAVGGLRVALAAAVALLAGWLLR